MALVITDNDFSVHIELKMPFEKAAPPPLPFRRSDPIAHRMHMSVKIAKNALKQNFKHLILAILSYHGRTVEASKKK